MKLWKALIVDDEALARQELRRMLKEHPHIDIRGEAASVTEAVEAVEAIRPDVIFLDIDLGGGSGFDILEKVPSDFRVIFVTAYDEFAIRAFKVNALDYLLKPIHPLRLNESLKRLGNPYLNEPGHKLNTFDKILVSHQRYSRLVAVRSISCIEACGDYTRIHTREGFSGTLHHTIKKWVERLPETLFFQCHRSYIVNIDRVERLDKKNKDSFELVLDRPQMLVPVSRGFSRKLVDTFRVD